MEVIPGALRSKFVFFSLITKTMSSFATISNVKYFTDENIYLFIYVLVGGLLVCGIGIALVAIKRWIQRRIEKASLLERTKENLEKLEQILSSQSSTDIRNLYILTVSSSVRSTFLDILEGFEDFSALRGYQSLLSFHSFSRNQIGFKYSVGEAGVGVSAGQAKTDFADYIERLYRNRDFETKAIFLNTENAKVSRDALKNRLVCLQKAFHSSNECHKALKRLFTTITEKGFSPVPIETPTRLESDYPLQTDLNSDDRNSTAQEVFLANTFTKRNQQIAQLELLVTRLVQNPNTLQATVLFEEARNQMIEAGSPDKEKIREWLQEAAQSMEQSDLEAEDLEILKKVYTSFHIHELLPESWK